MRAIVGRQAGGRDACPGEEKCIKYQTAGNKETVCGPCPSNYAKHKLSEIQGSEWVLPWIHHLIYLDGLKQVGCSFQLDDLTKVEWDGLLLIQQVRNEIEMEQYEKEKRKRQLQAATNTSVRKR